MEGQENKEQENHKGKKKVLFCASTVSHINNFHLPYLKAFHDMGYEVHVAANETTCIQWADKVVKLPFYKSLLSLRNVCAIFQSRKLLKSEGYDKISSNTTLAGLVVRLSALFLRNRPRIYYIVHGYLFNPKSWIKKFVYLIPDKIASYVTDVVMVMNQEDYEIAKKYKLYRDKLYYIDGMGISESCFKTVAKEEKISLRKQLGLSPDDFVFVYAAEFSKRKNQQLLIQAFAECSFQKGLLLLAGDGKELERCKKLAGELNLNERIRFLGYVNDVPSLYTVCDVVVSVSRIEGLPFNIMEAMGCGLPVIASDIKGHRELVEHGKTGLLFESENKLELEECMKALYSAQTERLCEYGNSGTTKAGRFTLGCVMPNVMDNYKC